MGEFGIRRTLVITCTGVQSSYGRGKKDESLHVDTRRLDSGESVPISWETLLSITLSTCRLPTVELNASYRQPTGTYRQGPSNV